MAEKRKNEPAGEEEEESEEEDFLPTTLPTKKAKKVTPGMKRTIVEEMIPVGVWQGKERKGELLSWKDNFAKKEKMNALTGTIDP
jgi:hypothetical protein